MVASTRAGRLLSRKSVHRLKPRTPKPAHRGLAIPIVTVLDRNGRLIVDEQRNVVRYALQGGVAADIVFACGTTGEWSGLTNSQRQQVAAITVEECQRDGRSEPTAEAWVGITAHTRAEVIANLVHALEISADAVVIAPLAVSDLDDLTGFISDDFADVFERFGRQISVVLHDGGDPNAAGPMRLHTRDVKTLSKLPYVCGINIGGGKAALGNYTRAASHFKRSGEFAIFTGSANLIFDLFGRERGLGGQMRHYWNRYLTRNAMPSGIAAPASNVMPREWQRAWQVCRDGNGELMNRYAPIMKEFDDACMLTRRNRLSNAWIAGLKTALRDIGVISSDAVALGTAHLDEPERREFLRRFKEIRRRSAAALEPEWLSRITKRPALVRTHRNE